MQFKESFITNAGNKLLSEAISNSKSETKSILWTKACTSSDDSIVSKTRKEIQALTDIQPYSSSGFVTNAINSETSWDESTSTESLSHHTTSLVCEITNKEYNGKAYSLGIWGKLVYSDGKEGSETLVAISRVSSTDIPDVIPNQNQSTYTANVTFVISIDDHAVNLIQAPDSFYATAQSLQSLENRAVTTHVEGSTTTGEKQNIYGDKTFKNNASVEGTFSVKSDTSLADTNTYNINPSASSTHSLGTDKLKWKSIYTNDLYGAVHGNITADEGKILSLTAQSITGTNTTGTSNLTVTGSLNGNATTATTATNLANSPSLSFTNASSSSAGSTLTVTAGGKTSSSATIEITRKAYQPYINTTNGNSVYPLTLAPAVTKNASITAGFKTLYTDGYNNLYYNPSTNTLTCPNFDGTATYATYDSHGYALTASAYVTTIGSYTKNTSVQYRNYSGGTNTYTADIPNGKLYAANSDGTYIKNDIDIAPTIGGILGNCSYIYNKTYKVTYNVGCITLVMFVLNADIYSNYDYEYTAGDYIITPKPVFLKTDGTDNDTILRMSGKYSAETASILGGLWKLLTNIGRVGSNNYGYALAVRVA